MIGGLFGVVKGGFRPVSQDGGIPAYAGMTGVGGGNDGRRCGNDGRGVGHDGDGDGNGGTQRRKDAMKSRRE